jgi:hypothetical protein
VFGDHVVELRDGRIAAAPDIDKFGTA